MSSSSSHLPTVEDNESNNKIQAQYSIDHVIQTINVDSISFSDKIGGKMTISCDETKAAIQRAAAAIKSEGLVAFPTETVYGLGADATSSRAVSKIFETKGRPSDNPLIVHIASMDFLRRGSDWEFPPTYSALVQSFWPGPLTILVPVPNGDTQPELGPISGLVTCGLSTVAIRMPAHPIARALLTEAGVPIAAPSANLSGKPSPTTAQHVARDFATKVPIILDGGGCLVGVESTVVDGLHPDGRLRILRLGGLSIESIQGCLSNAGLGSQTDGTPTLLSAYHQDPKLNLKPTTPGMKYKHYSPSAKVLLLDPTSHSSPRPDKVTAMTIYQLMAQLDLNSNHRSDSNQSKRAFKLGLMMIEGSPLAHEFARFSSNLSRTTEKTDLTSSNAIETRQGENQRGIEISTSNLGYVDQPEKSAQNLYAALRYLDESIGVDLILVECLPPVGLGKTVMERLGKASGHSHPVPILLPSSSR